MCTIRNNPKLERPKTKTVTVWKVFSGKRAPQTEPWTFGETDKLLIGKNVWDSKRAKRDGNTQRGFQVFRNRSDAEQYASYCEDIYAKVIVPTECIVKMSKYHNHQVREVWEVTEFNLPPRHWKNRIYAKGI